MAKINIPFNNQNYNIDESSFTAATSALRSHLSTVMNGSGATVKLGGTTYNIDSAKLTAATNDFIAHLGTIAGSGSKVVVGGVEYSVDSTKVASAITEIEAVLGGLLSGGSGESDNTNDILDNTYPIEYNTKTLKEGNNTSFNYSNVEWKRVSALTPTVEELQQKVVRVAGYVGNYVGANTTMGAIVAQYQADGFTFPIVVVPAATDLFGASIPAGIYVNADVGTNDSGYDVYFGDPIDNIKDIFPSQTVSGFEDYTFVYPFAQGLVSLEPAPFVLTVGETYFVEWDGTTYECVAKAADPAISGYDIYIGAVDAMPELGMTGNGEPFCIAHGVTTDGIDVVCTNSTASEHTIRVYQKASIGDPEVTDILDDTHPIEWNTKTVSENNSSFTLSGIQYVKVSNLVLTDDELKTKTFSVVREDGTVLNVSMVMAGQTNGWSTLTSRTAAYQCSILVVPEASELDGASISAGTYAKDMYASKGTKDTISVIDKA